MLGRRLGSLALALALPAALVALWWYVSTTSDSFYFPPLGTIVETFFDVWFFDHFMTDLVPSLIRLLLGFFIGSALGVVAGVVLGLLPGVMRAVSPVVDFLRAIPPVTIIPLTMVAFGIDTAQKVVLIAFVVLWPVLLNTVDGVRSISETMNETARAFRVSRKHRLTRMVVPAAAPQIFAGLRTSLSFALIMVVVSEMVAASNGLGYFALYSSRTLAMSDMWAGIILIGLLGIALNWLLTVAERRLVFWVHRSKSNGETS